MRTEQDRFNLAVALQQQTEIKVEADLQAEVGTEVQNLCLSAGLYLNCHIMGKVRKWLPWVRNVFVPRPLTMPGSASGRRKFCGMGIWPWSARWRPWHRSPRAHATARPLSRRPSVPARCR